MFGRASLYAKGLSNADALSIDNFVWLIKPTGCRATCRYAWWNPTSMIGLWAWRRPGVALKQPISDLLLGTTSWLGARRVFVPGCESSRLTSAVLLPGKQHLPGG